MLRFSGLSQSRLCPWPTQARFVVTTRTVAVSVVGAVVVTAAVALA